MILDWIHGLKLNVEGTQAAGKPEEIFYKNCSLCWDDNNLQDFWRHIWTCLVYYDGKWQDFLRQTYWKIESFNSKSRKFQVQK